MNHDVTSPPYYLLTQAPNDLLILGIKGQNNCLRRKASEILAEPKLLSGLSAEDRALIQAIASMDGTDLQRKRNFRKKVKHVKHCI